MTTGAARRFELRSDLSEMATLAEQLEQFCEQNGIRPDIVSVVNLALEEVVTNIISYGYSNEGHHGIRIDLRYDGASITARVEDDGVAFDPLQKEAPNVDVPIEDRPIGGLGIHLVKSLMDDVRYSRERDHNVLLIRKATALCT